MNARSSLLILLLLTHSVRGAEQAPSPEAVTLAESYKSFVFPFLKNHCGDCHSGDDAEAGIRFESFRDDAKIQQHYELWEKVLRLLKERQMPPKDAPQPDEAALRRMTVEIERLLATYDCGTERRPGRVTIRRLNRVEYDNTIRDLLGLEIAVAKDFPSDDVGEGFDNIADVLTISPILMEKYVDAAAKIARLALQDPEAKKRVFPEVAKDPNQRLEVVRRNLAQFASRAYRRPVSDEQLSRLLRLVLAAWQADASDTEIRETAVTAILSSPQFLFRIERDPEKDETVRELDGFELVSRLSYFLWSSMPDERLFDLARKGELRGPVLAAEVQRMLRDPRSQALVDNFAGQWLQLRNLSELTPDPDLFPQFDDALRHSMQRETELFFTTVMRDDLSVLEFLRGDFTFVDARLAQHYGMSGVVGDNFRRVDVAANRRGVVTHASILTLTSNPTRTSPVKRGKWILDNVLGEPPPPPPANVEELAEEEDQLGSLRERMEQHRSNESCAVCHRKMDTLGFGLEQFNAVGAFRQQDGNADIDPSGTLPGGVGFRGPAELMHVLSERNADAFARCLTKKMLTYALGRGLRSFDRCSVDAILDHMKGNDYRFSSMITGIVSSDPFTMREAQGDK